MFLIRGIEFSYEAVRDWEAKLTPSLIDDLRRRRKGRIGRSWYVDETYIGTGRGGRRTGGWPVLCTRPVADRLARRILVERVERHALRIDDREHPVAKRSDRTSFRVRRPRRCARERRC